MADLFEPDFGTAYYRSKDPIKNLKIRVKLDRVTSSSTLALNNHGDKENIELKAKERSAQKMRDSEEYTFSWQEKLFSPREIELYSDPQNCKTVLQKKYANDIKNILEKGKPTIHLFTYVTYDEYTSTDEPIQYMTTSSSEKPTAIAERMTQARRRKVGAAKRRKDNDVLGIPKTNVVDVNISEEQRSKNRYLSPPIQTMYIMADCSPSDRPAVKEDEIVLCSIQIDANCVVAIKPDFNNKPYVIETGGLGRDVYEFSLKHASKTMDSLEQLRENKMYDELYGRHAEFLHACVGSEFEVPPPEVLRLSVCGEIESAKNFEYDDLYLHFFVDLPKSWSASPYQQLAWVTQTCKTKIEGRDDVAFFSFPFNFELFYKKENVSEDNTGEMPHLPCILVEVLSLDSWNRFRTEGYTYLTVPSTPGVSHVTVNCWRPIGKSVFSELRRFFIGGSPELEDPTFAAIPTTFEGGLLGKYGFRTESTGSVTVKMNTVFQARAFMERRVNKKSLGSLMDNLGIHAVQANITRVIEAFKKARQRMSQARDNAAVELLRDTKDKQI